MLEEFVIQHIKTYFTSNDIVVALTKEINTHLKRLVKENNTDNDKLKATIKELEKQKNNIVNAIATIGINDTLTQKLLEIEAQIKDYSSSLNPSAIEPKTLKMITQEEVRSFLQSNLLYHNKVELKVVLNKYIERVEVGNKQIKVTFKLAVLGDDSGSSMTINREVERDDLTDIQTA